MGVNNIYTRDGDFEFDDSLYHNGKRVFRKMSSSTSEIELCKLIVRKEINHKNLIKIYHVGDDYIDMELLDTQISGKNARRGDIVKAMRELKTYLQELGIIYIDWKLDNMGFGEDGEIKLFDFDVSGLIDVHTNEWIVKPPKYWSYKQAVKNGMKKPIDIDNYAFDLEFTKYKSIYQKFINFLIYCCIRFRQLIN